MINFLGYFMNLRLFIVALLGTVCVAYTMDKKYKMHCADVLRGGFLYLNSFVVHTNIISKLARQEKTAEEVADIIDESLKEYYNFLDRSESVAQAAILKESAQSLKWYIFENILETHPDALDELEKVGRYKPRDKE